MAREGPNSVWMFTEKHLSTNSLQVLLRGTQPPQVAAALIPTTTSQTVGEEEEGAVVGSLAVDPTDAVPSGSP
ncbi:MAG: hypothetical protein ACK56F_23960, partial [bacterium]